MQKLIAGAKFNWKTSLAGLGSLLTGLGLFGAFIKAYLATGALPKYEELVAAAGLVSAGVAGILAKDGDKHGLPAVPDAPAPAAPATGGFVRLQLLVVVAVLALALGACAAFRGNGQTTTVTTGPSGGCVSSTGYVALGNTGIECNSVCVSKDTGVQVTCRPVAKPEAAQAMVMPAPATTPTSSAPAQ